MDHCYHCDLPVPKGSQYRVVIKGISRPMCCPGCEAVASTISELGLQSYYEYRTTAAERATPIDATLQEETAIYDKEAIQKTLVYFVSSEEAEVVLKIDGISCAACSWLIERQLLALEGVISATVNLSTHRARIRWERSKLKLSEILIAIFRIGYQGTPLEFSSRTSELERENRAYLGRIGIAGVGMAQVMMYAVALYAGAFDDMQDSHRNFIRWSSLIVATPVAIYAAFPFYRSAWRSLRQASLGMDVPVSIAILLAFSASAWSTLHQGRDVYFDSVCMFTFFLLLGRYLEFRARLHLEQRNQDRNPVLPRKASRVNESGTEMISLHELNPGDRIQVKAGETVAADGLLCEGSSSFDESLVTGEFVPRVKSPGDRVIAGSINREQPVVLKITELGQYTRIAAIMRLLDFAAASKPPIAILADQVARYFVGCVILVALAGAWYWSAAEPTNAFWITLSVLVVTCPCALSLATPAALAAATTRLSQQGMVVVRGHTLEGLTHATHVIFDKTGTLTRGELKLTSVETLSDVSSEDCQAIAAALENQSEHPIAKAFAESVHRATEVNLVPGQGIQGKIGGTRYRVGNPDFVLADTTVTNVLEPPHTFGTGQWLLLGSNQGPLAWFQLDDTLRMDAASSVVALQQRGLEVEILSGDQSTNVEKMAEALNIKCFQAGVSPENKLQYVNDLQAQGAIVVMVGDGINDVPVIAAADISIAMTEATDLTKAQADAVLVSGQLTGLVNAIDISRACRKIIRQNLLWALLYNALALPLALLGQVPPYAAAIGMSLSSLIVVLNALRLNRTNPRVQSTNPAEAFAT